MSSLEARLMGREFDLPAVPTDILSASCGLHLEYMKGMGNRRQKNDEQSRRWEGSEKEPKTYDEIKNETRRSFLVPQTVTFSPSSLPSLPPLNDEVPSSTSPPPIPTHLDLGSNLPPIRSHLWIRMRLPAWIRWNGLLPSRLWCESLRRN